MDWVCRKELSFQKVQHLYNAWNDSKPIKIGRDGQEIEPSKNELNFQNRDFKLLTLCYSFRGRRGVVPAVYSGREH